MAPRYLNLSELAYVRWRAEQLIRQHPLRRRSARVRGYAPLPSARIVLLQDVIAGLHRLPGVAV